MISRCESCEAAPVEVVEPCDNPEEPYHLCTACHQRLIDRELRPLEWYNLAKRHDPNEYLLHFYDSDGTAMPPESKVKKARRFPAPTLESERHSAERLLDFTITQSGLNEKLVAAWAALPADEVMATLRSRYATTRNASFRARILEVCAKVVGPAAADLVRDAWDDPEMGHLVFVAEAAAACLPFREGFDRALATVDALDGSGLRQQMMFLGYFHTPEALDWIEARIFSPVTNDWGRLAADSMLDWPRAERWISSGRPLSLAAIDALVAILQPRPVPPNPPLRLHNPPDSETLGAVLTGYMQRDSVPRVERDVTYLLAHLDALTGQGSSSAESPAQASRVSESPARRLWRRLFP